jgi:hypothetical protein
MRREIVDDPRRVCRVTEQGEGQLDGPGKIADELRRQIVIRDR